MTLLNFLSSYAYIFLYCVGEFVKLVNESVYKQKESFLRLHFIGKFSWFH